MVLKGLRHDYGVIMFTVDMVTPCRFICEHVHIMRHTNDAIKLIEGSLALGFSLSEAVQRALGGSLADFARESGHSRSAVSMCLSFYDGRVFATVREDLASALGVPREYLDRIIEEQHPSRKTPAA